MSLSGESFESFALLRRSMVPPVMNSTGTPVSCVNFLAAVSAIKSRQLPPQMLTTSLSWARPGSCDVQSAASATSATNKRFIWLPLVLWTDPRSCQQDTPIAYEFSQGGQSRRQYRDTRKTE